MKIYDINEIDCNRFIYSEPVVNFFGRHNIYIDYDTVDKDERKIRIQTPKCCLPFGLNSNKYDDNSEVSLSLDLSITGETLAMNRFNLFLEEFDKRNVSMACTHSYKWFNKRIDKNIVESLYKKQLNDKLRVKLNTKNGEFVGDVFDNFSNPSNISKITEGTHVQAILECSGLWFSPTQGFGVGWKVLQLMIFPSKTFGEFAFQDDEEDEKEDIQPI